VNFLSKINPKIINRLPVILVAVFIIIIIAVALIISANNLMEYIVIMQEVEKLEVARDNKLLEIDELKYYINTEIDDKYKERMARLMGYCYPDETIYYIE
jgi:type IV secretory pathway VirB3-like protein